MNKHLIPFCGKDQTRTRATPRHCLNKSKLLKFWGSPRGFSRNKETKEKNLKEKWEHETVLWITGTKCCEREANIDYRWSLYCGTDMSYESSLWVTEKLNKNVKCGKLDWNFMASWNWASRRRGRGRAKYTMFLHVTCWLHVYTTHSVRNIVNAGLIVNAAILPWSRTFSNNKQ